MSKHHRVFTESFTIFFYKKTDNLSRFQILEDHLLGIIYICIVTTSASDFKNLCIFILQFSSNKTNFLIWDNSIFDIDI